MPKPETNITESVGSYKRPNKQGEEVRAEFSMYRDRPFFSIRTWYTPEGKPMAPGKNGINLPTDEKLEFLKLIVAMFPEDVQLTPRAEP